MTSVHTAIWNFLTENGNSSMGAITTGVGSSRSKITSALATLQKSDLIYLNAIGGYAITDKWAGARMHDAKPRRINDDEWGCAIDAPKGVSVATGDLVIVVTKKGLIFDPAIINEVHKVYPKLDRMLHVCKQSKGIPVGAKAASPAEGNDLEKQVKDLQEKFKKPEVKAKPEPAQEAAPKFTKKQLKEALNGFNKIIEEKVEEEVAKRVKPEVIEVRAPDAPAVKIEGAHYLFPRLLRLVAAGFNVFMWGPPGTGKTTAALQVAKALSRKAEIDTLDPTTARSMVQGYMTPTGNPVHNVFTRCWEQGSVYVADEVDLAPGHVQTLFNSALANGHAPLAWGNVERADGFSFVATGNTAGRPTAAFPDRRPMSNAFADRLYFLYWPLDPAIECRAVGLKSPPTPVEKREKCDPKTWVTFVRCLRDWAADNAPALSITPRASLLGIQALAAGESPDAVADGLIFRGCDPDLRKKALRNVRW